VNLRDRLARMEKLGEVIRNAPRRCPSCGRPDPCLPSVVGLTPNGFYECVGDPPPCPACGASDPMVAIDPKTGEPEYPIKVILMGVDWNEWLERHKDREFPAPYARWLSGQTASLDDSSS
jgi:hypothetical protein